MIELAIAFGLLFAAYTAACAFLVNKLLGLLESERDKNRELMDRWYLTKNLPPSGTDLKARDERRQADAEARRDRPRPAADPAARASAVLASEEKRRMGQS